MVDARCCVHHLDVANDERSVVVGCPNQGLRYGLNSNAMLGKRAAEGGGMEVDGGHRVVDAHACMCLGRRLA